MTLHRIAATLMVTVFIGWAAGSALSSEPKIITIPVELRIEGMASDGMGGIYILNSNDLYWMGPTGQPKKVELPKGGTGKLSWTQFSSSSSQDGSLWYLTDTSIYRLHKQGGWEEIPISFPDKKPYQCRFVGLDSLHGHLFCTSRGSGKLAASTITASINFPATLSWTPIPPLAIEDVILSGNRYAWIRGNRIIGNSARLPLLSTYSLDMTTGKALLGPQTFNGRRFESGKILPDGKGGFWIWQWPEIAPIYCDTNLNTFPWQTQAREPSSNARADESTNVHALAQDDSGHVLAMFLDPSPYPYWNRKKFTISVGNLSTDTTGRKLVPLPAWWTGPLSGGGFRASLVRSSNGTWISLGNMIARHEDSTWTFYYSPTLQDQMPTEGNTKLNANVISASRYVLLAGLGITAYQSGPGWAGESAWAMLGFGVGFGAGVTGYFVGGLLTNGRASTVFLSLPLLGAALAVHLTDEGNTHGKLLLPFASSMAGTAISTLIFSHMPGGFDKNIYFVLPAAGLGAVIGYRIPL